LLIYFTGFFWSFIFTITLFFTYAAKKSEQRFGKIGLKIIAAISLLFLVINPSSILVTPVLIVLGYGLGRILPA